jgi:ADP-ribose pyrophosphatase
MRRQVYRGRVVDLGVERVQLPNGVETELEILRHAGAAAVVPVDAEGRVVLIRQYRHAAGGFLWEIPAGLLHEDEAPVACAQRELSEEAGLAAGRFDVLGAMLPTPGYSDERIHLFLGRDLHEAPMAREEDEVIHRIERMALVTALGMVRGGEIPDGKTALGLLLAAHALGVAS